MSGKVVYSDDKTPVDHGVVNFISDDGIARGEIQKNGTYVVGSLKKKDGLPSGDYQVYLSGTENVITERGKGMIKVERLIDRKYEKPKTSGLSVKVDKSMKYDIEVDRYKK